MPRFRPKPEPYRDVSRPAAAGTDLYATRTIKVDGYLLEEGRVYTSLDPNVLEILAVYPQLFSRQPSRKKT